jgi:hypothetical protein
VKVHASAKAGAKTASVRLEDSFADGRSVQKIDQASPVAFVD